MPKICTIILTVGLALGATQTAAQEDPLTAIQMVILGTQAGTTDGVFSTDAVSVSIGVGASVVKGVVIDPESGALGTGVAVGEGDLTGALTGFDTVTQYETSVCAIADGCVTE